MKDYTCDTVRISVRVFAWELLCVQHSNLEYDPDRWQQRTPSRDLHPLDDRTVEIHHRVFIVYKILLKLP